MPLSLATSKERRKRKERERLRKLELTRVRSRAKVAGRGRGRPRKTDVERAEKAAIAAIAKRALAEERRRAALPTGGGAQSGSRATSELTRLLGRIVRRRH